MIERLIPRLERLVEDEKQKEEKSQKRTDDLLRLVLIPVILLILTEIVKGQNLISITSYSIIALIIFFIIYVDLQYILQLKFFFLRRRLVQLQHFISDLRSISDMRRWMINSENVLIWEATRSV